MNGVEKGRKEGRKEGKKEGIKEGMYKSIKNLMDSLNWTMLEAMKALKVPESDYPIYEEMMNEN